MICDTTHDSHVVFFYLYRELESLESQIIPFHLNYFICFHFNVFRYIKPLSRCHGTLT